MELIKQKNIHELKKEGITKELMQSINMLTDHSPVQFNEGDEPVNLLQCKDGFNITPEFGVFLKDEKGKLIVISDKQARVARARYMLNFKYEIFEAKIIKEQHRLEDLAIKKATEILSKAHRILTLSELIPVNNTLEQISLSLATQTQKDEAKSIATESMLNIYFRLKELLDSKNFDALYIMLFQDGLPQVASYSTESESDINALAKSFHSDNITKTIESIQANPHLYNVAKFNILKK